MRDESPIIDADEAVAERLLLAAADGPALRAEFVASLERRLDREFAATASARPRRRHSRRWQGVVAAATLLLGVAIWSNPPAWANFLRGLMRGFDETPLAEAPKLDHTASAAGRIVVGASEPPAQPPDRMAASRTAIPAAARPATSPSADVALTASRQVHAQTWKPSDRVLSDEELSRRIDALLAEAWQAHGIRPAEPASDAEFMRRAYLDLTGRVPSVAEAREFLGATELDRRDQLVERLLAHRDYATHFAAVWRTILLPAEVDLTRLGGAAKFDEWLAERFAANQPYDKIVQELLLAEGRVSQSGPLLFYAAVKLNPEELAARTSRAFLGVRMECAQCHDHPFDDDISQKDFWGFAAFFARISRPEGKMEMTSPVLQVRDNPVGDVKLPESEQIVPPRLPESPAPLVEEADSPSRRRQMVDWLTARQNKHFAQATVNRIWSHLFGRGLVDPVDDMRPANLAIVPEVLDALSRDFAASGFDLRRLVRAMVLTKAYQLSSASPEDDPSRTLYFAQMNIKSFTAEQLYDCISVVTGSGGGSGVETSVAGLARTDDAMRAAFVAQFRTPPGQATDYQAGIPQALTMMHGGLVHRATHKTTSGLLRSLSAPFFTDKQRVETLFLATLSRYPQDAESAAVLQQLADVGPAERQQALGDVLWALLNSAEFTLNH